MKLGKEEPVMTQPNPTQSICSFCHQPILPTYYFCPNCGKPLATAPLSTTLTTQLGIYALSIILPSLCFLFIAKWPGIKYVKSNDVKASRIGKVACVLLIASTVATFWYAYVITQRIVQTSISTLNASLEGY